MNKRLIVICFVILVSLPLYARGKKPYYINSHVSTGSSPDYSYAGLNIELYNRGVNTITSFTLTFSLYDADGLPLFDDDYKTITVDCDIPPKGTFETCISMDDYIDDVADMESTGEDDDQWGDPYGVDAIFVDAITYDDGGVWKDDR